MSGSLSGGFQEDEGSNANVEDLEQRILTLQQELQDIEVKYKEELESEKVIICRHLHICYCFAVIEVETWSFAKVIFAKL